MRNSTHKRLIILSSLLSLALLSPVAHGAGTGGPGNSTFNAPNQINAVAPAGINVSAAQYGKAGDGEPELGSILIKINVGHADEGRRSGEISLHTETPSLENATPLPLKFNTGNNKYSEVIRDGEALRQIVAPEAFVDIVTDGDYAYSINFYLPSEHSATKTGGLYTLVSGAVPNTTWKIENPDASSTSYNKLQVSKITGTDTKVYLYTWDEATQTWSLSKGGGLQVLSKKTQATATGKVVTESIADNAGAIVSMKVSTFQTFPWGSELVKVVNDPGTGKANLTETRTYYSAAGIGYGKLKSIVKPNTSWVAYSYDADGRKTMEITPWLYPVYNVTVPHSALAAANRAVNYTYTLQDSTDANLPEDKVRPRLVTETILGNTVKKTFYVYKMDATTRERTEIMQQAVSPNALYNDATNLATTKVFYPFAWGTAQSGKVKSITKPDGAIETYTYKYGKYAPASTAGQPGVFTEGTGKAIRTMVVHGTTAHPQGIAGKTTQEITISDEFGRQVQNEIQAFNGNTYETISYEISSYDDHGRLANVYYSDGSHQDMVSDCCNKIKEVDRDGITTNYTNYDALGRLLAKVKEGSANIGAVTTSFTYDAAGRQLTKTVSGGNLSLTSKMAYDTAGRLKTSVDEDGLSTGYIYSPDGRSIVVTKPGGATEITTHYRDGQLISIFGTAVTASSYEYGVNTDGTRWSKVKIGAGASSTWEKTTVDMLGRTVLTERPSALGTGIEIARSYYDAKGYLTKTTTPGRAAILYQYDELGERTATAIDVDGNGVIDWAGKDRISATDSNYVFKDGYWWMETAKKQYATDNSNAPSIINATRTRLTGLGGDGLTSEVEIADIHGNKTLVQTYIDWANKITESVITYPDAANEAGTIKENGLTISERGKDGIEKRFGYDALGRSTGVTDPRTGTTITHYDTKGWIDYIQDPAGNRTLYAYDPSTGRKIVETNAKGLNTRFSYTPKGQLWRTWGEAAYPVEYTYDDLGRKSRMSTYRGGTRWNSTVWPIGYTGAADVTTWNYVPGTDLLSSKVYANNTATRYTYGAGGLLKIRTLARKNGLLPMTTTYSYDPATAELTKIDYSDTTPDVAFFHDRLGRQTEINDAVGKHIFKYNDKLQLENETISGLYSRTITRSYSDSKAPGRYNGFSMGEVISGAYEKKYEVMYGYEDATGRLNHLGWQAGVAAPNAADYTYQPNSNLLGSLTTGNRQTVYAYEPNRDLLKTVQNNFNTESISRYGYNYGATGQRDSVDYNGRDFEPFSGFNQYRYDARNELSDSVRFQVMSLGPPGFVTLPFQAFSYLYDSIGNRTKAWGDDATSPIYTANNLNQYTGITGTPNQIPTYDLDGNMTFFDGKTYTFDGENRLLSLAPKTPVNGGQKVEFLYDYMGRRVQKTVSTYQSGAYKQTAKTLFVYDGWNLLEEISSPPQTQPSIFYVWGLDVSGSLKDAGGVGGLLAVVRDFSVYDSDQDGDVDITDLQKLAGNDPARLTYLQKLIDGISHTHLYLYDANGNVGQAIDAGTGAAKARYEYAPYGKALLADGVYGPINPFRFSTKYQDGETELVYYGLRYYSPGLGRWINRDPIGEEGGINEYSMLNNNVINEIDELGLRALSKDEKHILYSLRSLANKAEEKDPELSKAVLAIQKDIYDMITSSKGEDDPSALRIGLRALQVWSHPGESEYYIPHRFGVMGNTCNKYVARVLADEGFKVALTRSRFGHMRIPGATVWHQFNDLGDFKVTWIVTPFRSTNQDGSVKVSLTFPLAGRSINARTPKFGDIISYSHHIGIYLGRNVYVSATAGQDHSGANQPNELLVKWVNNNEKQLYRSPE